MTDLGVSLTFDTDSDLFDQSLDRGAVRRLPGWRGIEEGIPAMLDVLDELGCGPVTWFVRCDNQLGDLYGDPAYLLRQHAALWDRCRERGDELGWHPHLYRLVDGDWVQEMDARRLAEAMDRSFEAFCEVAGPPRVSRIGEAFCSNEIMDVLERLGIAVDSSAMPGRVRIDDERALDWRSTPDEPYRPSRVDYRVPGPEHREILEVPMTMVPVRAEYDDRPYRRYLDLSFRDTALAGGIEVAVADRRAIVTMTHPSGVLRDLVPQRHGLIAFDIENFRRNLVFLLDALGRSRQPWRFVTMSSHAAEAPA